MKIPIYTTLTEPENITPFSMIFGSIWKAYDAGELTPEKILLLAVLYRQVNAYEGIGRTSYEKICVMMKRKPTSLNVNGINKVMMSLRDEHELIWFPNHSGSKDFSYVIADFKLALKPNETEQKWIDIKPYIQSQEQSSSRDSPPPIATIQTDVKPRLPPPKQMSEGSNSGGIKSVGDSIRERYGRPPQTNTDTQT